MAIVLLGLSGVFVGGAYSLYKQGASRVAVVIVAALALLSGAAGVAWLLPEG